MTYSTPICPRAKKLQYFKKNDLTPLKRLKEWFSTAILKIFLCSLKDVYRYISRQLKT